MSTQFVTSLTFIAKGSQGMAYLDEYTGYIVKVAIQVEGMETFIEEEAVIQSLAASIGVAPAVYSWDEDTIVMDRVSRTFQDVLDEYLDDNDWGSCRNLYYWAGVQLGKLHQLGVVHMDAHPKNWMVDDEGMPILIDYGFAEVN